MIYIRNPKYDIGDIPSAWVLGPSGFLLLTVHSCLGEAVASERWLSKHIWKDCLAAHMSPGQNSLKGGCI